MGSWFFKPATPLPPQGPLPKDKAVLDLKRARDNLTKAQKKNEQEKEIYHQKAKQLILANQKARAMTCLKMMKYKEQMIERADTQLINLMRMIDTIDWETQQQEVLNGLKAGNAALKKIQEEMTIEDAEKIMQDTEEAYEYQQQISKIIGTSLGEADDEAVMQELAELEAEESLKVSGSLPSVPVAPVASQARPAGVQTSEKVSSSGPATGTRQRVAVPA